MSRLTAIAPLDGRYRKELEELGAFFSEAALLRYRVQVEVEYLIALGEEKKLPQLRAFSNSEQDRLRRLYQRFTPLDARAIKRIETRTQHDVKAVEYFLRSRLGKTSLKGASPWIHFALTSEDVNNLAYTLTWRDALREVLLPQLKLLQATLTRWARRERDSALLALTHGQPATPTTLGKELAVFAKRLQRQLDYLKNHRLTGKLNGATGTWGAHRVAYPSLDWIGFSARLVRSLGLSPTSLTTQVESYDSLAESYQALSRINTILRDLCRDLWLYISRGILVQRKRPGEVGSSTMPHKVNPIQFENAEGNLGLAVTVLGRLATELPRSRLQRDLTGSTLIRNQGLGMGYTLLAVKNILRGWERLGVNHEAARDELDRHWEVLAEAVQVILRKNGRPWAYERLKDLTRGATLSKAEYLGLVEELDLPPEDRETLLALSPETYTGLAPKLVDLL